jgi:aryl-alcohol dehydrogenase-like predicted oxidoreductase
MSTNQTGIAFRNKVGSLGLGFMRASFDATNTDRETTIAALHHAMSAGIVLFDTADIYAPTWDSFGHNELLLAEAIRTWGGDSSTLVIATKAGITRKPGEIWGRNASLDYLLRAAEASAGRLGLNRIPLWQHHRLDPSMQFETQIENLAALRERGIFENLGVSNYNAKQLSRAIEIAGPIVSVQNQFNPAYRQESEVFAVCEANNISYLPWSPMRGVNGTPTQPIFETIGNQIGFNRFEVALAWLRSQSSAVVPIPGVTRIESVSDAINGLKLELTSDQLARIDEGLTDSLPIDAELLSDQPH